MIDDREVTMTAITPSRGVSARIASLQLRRRPQRRRPGGLTTSYIFLAVLMMIYLVPLFYLLNTALKTEGSFNRDPLGLTSAFAFSNFAEAWVAGNFSAYILNSVGYTAIAATAGTLISLVLAFPVSRGYVKHPRLWYGIFVVSLFLPNILITQFQLVLRLGLYDTQLGYILVMATSVGIGPLLIAGYLKSVPKELDEAAALDGAGYWRYLFTFVPRLTMPALVTVLILQAIGVWNDIILATILMPNRANSPISLGLFAFQGQYSNQWPLLAAATLIVAAPLLMAYVFLQRFLIGGVLGGTLKG